jgi:hypothetical protein
MYKETHLDKILYYKKKDRYELFYEKYGNPVYLQLSKGYLSKKIEETTKYIWLGYFSNTIEKNKTFNYLTKLKNCVEKNCDITLETFFYDNGICIPCQNNKGNLQLEIYIRQNDTIWEGNLLEFPEKSYIIPIVYVENIINKDNKWRINLKLVQICVFPLYQKFGKCIIDFDNAHYIENRKISQTNDTLDEINNYVSIKMIDHPLYGKYFKMRKMGIPKAAVIQKMNNEISNIDSFEILNRDYDDIEKIKLVMIEEHDNYARFFKMIRLGIPKAAVEQKMILEGIDINYLDKAKQLIPNIEIIKYKDIFSDLMHKKLKPIDDTNNKFKNNRSTDLHNNLVKSININNIDKSLVKNTDKNTDKNIIRGINMEELLNKRNTLLGFQK